MMLIVSLIILVISIYFYHFYNADDVSGWDVPKGKTKEAFKSELIENNKRKFKPFLKLSYITSSASLATFVVAVILKIILSQNYIFIVNEILPRLTNR